MSEIETVKQSKVMRPTDLEKHFEKKDDKLLYKSGKDKGKEADVAKYIRKEGLPNPLIKYRVTVGSKPASSPDFEPLDIDAVDSAEAINRYITARQIKTEDVCRMSFQVSEQEQ